MNFDLSKITDPVVIRGDAIKRGSIIRVRGALFVVLANIMDDERVVCSFVCWKEGTANTVTVIKGHKRHLFSMVGKIEFNLNVIELDLDELELAR